MASDFMKFTNRFKKLALTLATLGIVLPNPNMVFAADQTASVKSEAQKPISDVSLDAHNRLVGQVVDGKGTAKAGTVVTVASLQGEAVQKVTTDAKGNFSAEIKQGGVYMDSGKESSAAVRVWTKQAA